MNRRDSLRLHSILDSAIALMSVSPSRVNPAVSNMDVFEAVMGDISLVLNNHDPKFLAEFVKQDMEGRK